NRASRGHDVVDDEHALVARDLESAPEDAGAAALLALGVDRADTKLSPDPVRENDPAGRRTRDRRDALITDALDDATAEQLGLLRPLEHPELLEVHRRVLARREEEVPFAQRAHVAEDPLDVGRGDHAPTVSCVR